MSSSASPAHSERLHALDALRAIAMLLGIALHATLAYWPDVFPLWAADDPASSAVCLGAFAVMLGSYHVFVRYTWIGVLLNGPKLRNQRTQRRAAAHAEAVV